MEGKYLMLKTPFTLHTRPKGPWPGTDLKALCGQAFMVSEETMQASKEENNVQSFPAMMSETQQ